MLSSLASAQIQAATKQQCTQRCVSAAFDIPKLAPFNQRLKEIRGKKEAENDPAKRKVLEQAESDELDRRQDAQEKICHQICEPLSDE